MYYYALLLYDDTANIRTSRLITVKLEEKLKRLTNACYTITTTKLLRTQ